MNIELFFDYACPFCYRGHGNLLNLLDKYPQLEINWKPCESHPRPEPASVHSDLAIQGMYFIRDNQGDLWKYHEAVYQAVFEEKLNISDPEVLVQCAKRSTVDLEELRRCLMENRYGKEVTEGNIYAWQEKALMAVPSYLSGDKFIGSMNGILVSKTELDQFLSGL